MTILKDIVSKEKATFASVEREGKFITHVKGFERNADVNVEKGEKYWVKVEKNTIEKVMR